MSRRVRRILIAAIAALALAGLIGVHFAPGSAGRLEARLQAAAERALTAREHRWAEVRVSGQTATVSGRAPSEAARLDALAAVRGAAWSGGALAGGVTRVTDETVLAAPARSAAFRADAGNGRITLTGTVADEAARLALAEFAMRLFPAGAETHLAVDPAATAGEDWETAVKRLIAQLARLDSGGAVLNVRRAGLYGRAGTGQTARAAAAALDDMPEGYSAAALVLALDAPAGDPGRGAAAQIGDARDCGLVLEAARGPAPVRFLPGQAALEPRSRRIAARLGEAFRFCPEGVLAVAVQPTGDSPYEQSMAAARAREVAAALTEGGAPAARVEAGAGETGQGRLVRLAVRAPAGEG